MPKVMGLQAVLCSAFAFFALSVTGCGVGTSAPGAKPNPDSLSGNWLLVGELPFIGPNQTPANNNFGLAMTFSIVANQIAGGGSGQVPCGQFITNAGGVVSGSVAPDGSFTAQSSATQPSGLATLQIQGTVPAANASSWTGTYSYSTNNSTCPFSSSGPIAAVRIADVTGTYAGSGVLFPAGMQSSGTGQPISLTFTLQQEQADAQTSSVNGGVLTGSVQVQGTSCFSSGQIIQSQPQVEGVLGTNLLTTFTMDDGSHLNLSAHVEDPASSKLGAAGVLISGGKCDGQFSTPFELSRQ